MHGPIVGIDLGTTNSLVAVCDERGPRVLRDARGGALVPSVVRFSADGSVEEVGVGAVALAAQDREFLARTVSGSKRALGRSLAEVSVDGGGWALRGMGQVVDDGRGRPSYEMPHARRSPEQVAAAILRHLMDFAQAQLGGTGEGTARAVITVPAYFDDAQRQATRDAARLAGIEAVRIINEPTAAALAYGIGREGGSTETIAVFDLGGGTFDISILQVTPPAKGGAGADLDAGLFRVLSTAGDTQLGGDDLDIAMAREVCPGAHDLPPEDRHALLLACTRAKHRLSDAASATIPFRGVEHALTAARLAELAAPWVSRAIAACDRAWSDAGRPAIDRLLMVGGSTRSPFVRVAAGAFFGVEPSTALDPDQVVALGASIQAAVLSGRRTDILLLDVVPLSLGIETAGGAFAKLIMRNSTIPTRASEMFSTGVDGQRRIALHVLQGERELARDCRSLAQCELTVPSMPAGIPQVEVTFTVDASGLLSVHAMERRTGIRAGVQVIPSYGLSRDEVEAMERDSILHARDDMRRHRVIDLIANASLDLRWVESATARVGGTLPAHVRETIQAAAVALQAHIDAARADLDAVDPDEFFRAKEALDRASVPVHELSIVQSLKDLEVQTRGTAP
ncbi:MAG: Hsp70 family protein [Planctomycetota bacterium]|nr:Hsp70 family protein [Planctomycetota bacterium]MDA1105791.1 Hsp70 family protein [Planctomycetota bacterium]